MERILDLEFKDLSTSPSFAQVSMTLSKLGLSLHICKMGKIIPFFTQLL